MTFLHWSGTSHCYYASIQICNIHSRIAFHPVFQHLCCYVNKPSGLPCFQLLSSPLYLPPLHFCLWMRLPCTNLYPHSCHLCSSLPTHLHEIFKIILLYSHFYHSSSPLVILHILFILSSITFKTFPEEFFVFHKYCWYLPTKLFIHSLLSLTNFLTSRLLSLSFSYLLCCISLQHLLVYDLFSSRLSLSLTYLTFIYLYIAILSWFYFTY